MTIRRTLSTLAIVVAAGVAVLVALTSPGDQGSEAVTLTGCLRTGGNPAVYLLRGAETPAANAAPAPGETAAPEDYLLVAIPSSLDLKALVNHRIAITGLVSDAKGGPSPPEEANAAERALKRLAVQSAREAASNCSTGGL